MVLDGPCNVCQVASTTKCSACFQVFYCGQQHQKDNWKDHKKTCSKPYKLKETSDLGRYMVAARDLQPGDIVLREKVAVHGPNQEASPPLCVICYTHLTKANFLPCPRCSVPVCSAACASSERHQPECEIMRRCPTAFYSRFDRGRILKQSKPSLEHANWQLICPLRVLLLKKQDLKRYRSIMALQSHVEERKGGEAETRVETKVVKLLEQYKMHTDAFTDVIHQICGIFDTNSFDLPGDGGKVDLAGLFPNAAMLMHSCMKNTRMTMTVDYTMTLFARDPIPKGSPIYHSYSRVFLPTTLRRIMLFTGKHFSCECRRCVDPTECGSFASALRCGECCGPVVADEPLDLKTEWSCHECGKNQIEGTQVAFKERAMKLELESLDRFDLLGHESFLSRHSSEFHPGHALLLHAKQKLCSAYGRVPGFERERLSLDQARRKTQLCREVVKAVEVLETGIAARRGISYYDLASALQLQVEKEGKKSCDADSLLSEARTLLEKSVNLLALEPAGTSYAKLHDAAKGELMQLKIKM